MAFFDMPEHELRTYSPTLSEPANFDAFWQSTLADARSYPLDVRAEAVASPFALLEFYDVTFAGFGGQPVKAWLIKPRGSISSNSLLPCIVEFLGYGGGRGFPFSRTNWALCGYAQLVMDLRGQGAGWARGATGDHLPTGSGPQGNGKMTLGIEHPENYYYRRVFTDAVRAIETARSLPGIDPEAIVLNGASQGGGITLAACALSSNIKATVIEVPFLCHFQRASEITDAQPYNEIASYLRIHREATEQVFQTLSYFDGVHFARRCTCPTLFSCGLMDMVCPPSTVFAAFNNYAGEKKICTYPYNGHEGGGEDFVLTKSNFVTGILNSN